MGEQNRGGWRNYLQALIDRLILPSLLGCLFVICCFTLKVAAADGNNRIL